MGPIILEEKRRGEDTGFLPRIRRETEKGMGIYVYIYAGKKKKKQRQKVRKPGRETDREKQYLNMELTSSVVDSMCAWNCAHGILGN